jgi:hypothetical protein
MIKYFYLFLFTLVVACSHSQLQPNDRKFESGNDVDKWMQSYYKSPNPELFLAGFDEYNRVAKNPGMTPLGITFFSELFKKHPDRVEGWILQVKQWKLSPIAEQTLWSAIKYSGVPNANQILNRELKSSEGYRNSIIKETIDIKLTEFWGKVPPSMPQDLDALWGRFFATGNKSLLNPIADSLEWSPEENEKDVSLGKSLVGIAAEWSLAANAKTNEDILIFLKDRHKSLKSSKVKNKIASVIEKAENKSKP